MYDQNFYGGGRAGDGEGLTYNSERCLKWGGGECGVIKGSF